MYKIITYVGFFSYIKYFINYENEYEKVFYIYLQNFKFFQKSEVKIVREKQMMSTFIIMKKMLTTLRMKIQCLKLFAHLEMM